ncbi:MAG: hypothetical protein ABIQ88_13285 [Chitinophagaceae bacterium]
MIKYLALFCVLCLQKFTIQYSANHNPPLKDFPTKLAYQLAFVNFGPLNTDIFVADADGTNAVPLLPDASLDYNASFSTDGTWVLFTSERNGLADIYRVHPDGTALEQLTSDPSYDDQACFAPDGKRIAFVSSRAGEADIFVLELATKKITNITNHLGGDFRPCWSPDGEWLAFSSDRDSKKPIPEKDFRTLHSTEIYTVRFDGTNLVRRTNKDAFFGSPCWSKDGKKLLVYETSMDGVRRMTSVSPILRAGATSQISVINLNDNFIQSLTNGTGEKISPRWLPDSSIAYVNADKKGGIVFLDGRPKIDGDFQNPRWSPDGRKMIFHRETSNTWPPLQPIYSRNKKFQLIRSGVFPSFSPLPGNSLICNDKTAAALHNQIMQMNRDGTGKFILFGDSVKSALAPVWSPNGDRIAFGFGRFFQGIQGPAMADIAIINKDGTGLKILTDGTSNNGFPSWSTDGQKIVYRTSTEKHKGLSIIDVTTGKITSLTNSTQDNFPVWSPTENVIAFTRKLDKNYDIYTIKPDGTDLKRLTTDPGNDSHCAWSGDGKWIAYSTASRGFKDECPLFHANPQAYGEICVMRADGSNKIILTDNQYEDGSIGWMPVKKESP